MREGRRRRGATPGGERDGPAADRGQLGAAEAGATGEFLHKGLGLADEAVVRHGRELDTGHAAAARLEEPGGAPQTHVVAELTAADR